MSSHHEHGIHERGTDGELAVLSRLVQRLSKPNVAAAHAPPRDNGNRGVSDASLRFTSVTGITHRAAATRMPSCMEPSSSECPCAIRFSRQVCADSASNLGVTQTHHGTGVRYGGRAGQGNAGDVGASGGGTACGLSRTLERQPRTPCCTACKTCPCGTRTRRALAPPAGTQWPVSSCNAAAQVTPTAHVSSAGEASR